MSSNWRQADEDDDGGLAPPMGRSSSGPTPPRRKPSVGMRDSSSLPPPGPRGATPGLSPVRESVSRETTVPHEKESTAFLKTAVFKPEKPASALKPKSALAPKAGTAAQKTAMRGTTVSIVEKPNVPRIKEPRKEVKFVYPEKAQVKKVEPLTKSQSVPRVSITESNIEGEENSKRDLKRFMSNASIIDDRNKLETRWDWTNMLVQHAFKPYRRALSENDDLLPDPDELEAFDAKDEDDEEQRYLDDIRDEMLDDGQLSEREIAAFFSGFTLFNAKVKSLQSQLESAKKMAFRHVAPTSASASSRSLADHRTHSLSDFTKRQPKVRLLGDAKKQQVLASNQSLEGSGRGLSCKSLSIRRIQDNPKTSAAHQKLLKELEEAEKKQKKLEKQLKQAGVQIAEDIPYDEAKGEVEKIAERMQEIGSSEVTHPDKKKQAELREEYFRLEQEMEKFSTALMLTDEYIEEQEEKEMEWDRINEPLNNEALKKLRRHMPVDVKSLSEAQLCSQPTPNGKKLPKAIAKKFKRTNVLQLLRTNPEDLARMHPSTLENMRVTGMTLTERRAMYAHLKDIGPKWKAMQAESMTERKWTWWSMMRTNFKETLDQYEYHVEQYGPPDNHPYATRDNPKEGCPMIGKQCPIRADQQPSYNDDYGFTDEAEYEVTVAHKADAEDPGARAASDAAALAREKRAAERLDALKKHYNGVLQVSLASGSCECMDEALDTMEAKQITWIEHGISQGNEDMAEDEKRKEMKGLSDALNELRLSVLQFAERSGMQLTGKKDANANKMDIRSQVELGLCEEVYEVANDFFSGMKQRIKELGVKDGRLKVAISQLRELLDELHERNLHTLESLGVEKPQPSRKHKTRKQMTKDAKARIEPATEEEAAAADDPGMTVSALAGRGGLMAEIAGKGRGRGGAGGRGDLMSAIAARGRGRGDAAGGRGDLMSAIAARGRGGRGGRDGGSGRGGLMSEIAARGRGRGGGGSGRGDLIAAIAARGAGRSGRSSRGGGRGDLMAAIAARGSGGRSGRGSGSLEGSSKTSKSASASGGGGRGNFLDEIKAKAAALDGTDE